MHKQSRGTALAVLLCCFCFPVFAEEIPAAQPIISPVEVLRGENGELQTMEKVYVLSKEADPGMIPTENFTENGVEYVLTELRQQDNSVEESKPHTETVSIHTSSNDTETVVSQFKPEIEAETEDGYTGKLSFDPTSLDVVAAG